MKLTICEETKLKFLAEKPDETLSKYFRDQLVACLWSEIKSFMEEVAVAMRKIEPGQTLTLTSRPIAVTVEKPPNPESEAREC